MAFLKNIPSTLSDNDLLEAYKTSGSLDVLASLYQRYMDLIYGTCLKYLKETEDAKDATLNIFEELITKAKRHEITHFRNWLHQLAKNHCLMRLRSLKKMPTVNGEVSFMQSDENLHLNGSLEKEEHFEHLHACLQQLTPEQRQAIELFYLESKCYNEIAALTGLEWNKVRSFIQNGRRNLKLCMDRKILESSL